MCRRASLLVPLELRLKAAGELRKKAGPEGRGQEGLRDRSRGREGRWAFMGDGRAQSTHCSCGGTLCETGDLGFPFLSG